MYDHAKMALSIVSQIAIPKSYVKHHCQLNPMFAICINQPKAATRAIVINQQNQHAKILKTKLTALPTRADSVFCRNFTLSFHMPFLSTVPAYDRLTWFIFVTKISTAITTTGNICNGTI
jgi:hypothetical protein